MATSTIQAQFGGRIAVSGEQISSSDTVEIILTRDILPVLKDRANGVYCLSNSWPSVSGGWSAIIARCQNNESSAPSLYGIFGLYQKLYYFRGFTDSTGWAAGPYIHQVSMTQTAPT